jgi:hypothetical protein
MIKEINYKEEGFKGAANGEGIRTIKKKGGKIPVNAPGPG